MTINRIKFVAIALFTLPLVAIAIFSATIQVSADPIVQEDVAATYKAKCAMCHSPKAEKAFDLTKTDEQHVEIILKGKKDAKPPMPGYEAKGMTKEQAQALVTYMRDLRKPAQ